MQTVGTMVSRTTEVATGPISNTNAINRTGGTNATMGIAATKVTADITTTAVTTTGSKVDRDIIAATVATTGIASATAARSGIIIGAFNAAIEQVSLPFRL